MTLSDNKVTPIEDLSLSSETQPPIDLSKIKIEQLDHLIHALRISGQLALLTDKQKENILYAFQETGFMTDLCNTQLANYSDGHLISFYDADFLKNDRFRQAYQAGQATQSNPGADIRWRVYVLCWAASLAFQLEGDFVECGVNRGGYSLSVMEYIDFRQLKEKTFYLLDTFNGFPDEDHHLLECSSYAYSNCFEDVKDTFKSFDNVTLIRGRIPNTLEAVTARKISYLSIDIGYPEAEIPAATFFWDRLVKGGLMIIDDYGQGVHHLRQKRAFNSFAEERGVPILLLPTGQGLMVKI